MLLTEVVLGRLRLCYQGAQFGETPSNDLSLSTSWDWVCMMAYSSPLLTLYLLHCCPFVVFLTSIPCHTVSGPAFQILLV